MVLFQERVTHILKTAAESDAYIIWRIKVDGLDVVKGLRELMNDKWSGGADLDDRKLKCFYKIYTTTQNHCKYWPESALYPRLYFMVFLRM